MASVQYRSIILTLQDLTVPQWPSASSSSSRSIRRCYRHAFDDADCAVNRAHVRALRENLAFFSGRALHITEYWLDASRQSGYRRPAVELPVPMDIVGRDIDFYVGQGATSIASYAVMCDDEYWAHLGPPPLAEYGEALACAGGGNSAPGERRV